LKGRKGTLAKLAYILAIVGGVIMIGLSLLEMLSYAVTMPLASPIGRSFGVGIVTMILGIVAVVLSKRVSELVWALVLIVIGLLGGGVGGFLVLIGGVLGLLSRFK
jgi:hypothetical protein